MNDISIKHLRYFCALATHRHFGHAANSCAISQPALSMQIRELEDLLGMPLVARAGKHIGLTPFGEALAVRASAILHDIQELGDFARAHSQPFSGELRLGVIPTVAPYFLPAIITDIATHYPRLHVRPREAVTQKLMQDLSEMRLDAALVALPVSGDMFTQIPIFSENFVLVRPKADARKPAPCHDELRSMNLLLLEEGHCFRDQALSFCNITPSAHRNLIEGSSLSTLVRLAGAGIGVTLIPEIAIAHETRMANVAIARLPDPQPSRTIAMVWRKSSPLAKELAQIAATLKSRADLNLMGSAAR